MRKGELSAILSNMNSMINENIEFEQSYLRFKSYLQNNESTMTKSGNFATSKHTSYQ